LAPALPIPLVSVRHLAAIRDIWLRGVLLLGALALAWHGDVWLACMACWYVCRWRSTDLHASLITWVAIGATWYGLRSLPAWAWDYIPYVWLAIMVGHVGMMLYMQATLPKDHPFWSRKTLLEIKRVKSTLGSPAISAISLALMAPFCPWWLWPVLAVGLYITWSWLAFIGVAVGLAWTYPHYAPHAFVAITSLLAAWVLTWHLRRFHVKGERIFEWVPRGDSFDSVINRLIVWWLIAQAWWTGGHRLLGQGPYALEPQLRRWASQCWIETPNGEAHVEWAQVLYEYGLLGLAGAAALAAHVLSHGHLRDPVTAAFLAGLVMSFAHWAPARQPAVALVVLACAAGALR
jgi:hypothetical protein